MLSCTFRVKNFWFGTKPFDQRFNTYNLLRSVFLTAWINVKKQHSLWKSKQNIGDGWNGSKSQSEKTIKIEEGELDFLVVSWPDRWLFLLLAFCFKKPCVRKTPLIEIVLFVAKELYFGNFFISTLYRLNLNTAHWARKFLLILCLPTQ